VRAKAGGNGSGQNSFGADGNDIVLEVPIGTIARDAETNEKLLEILEDGDEHVLIKGGRGGQGNSHYKTATNQTPRFAQPGEDAIDQAIILELKLLADVGLVGFPNAGKSTLLSTLSAATPEIADYPFTTLTPNLGVVAYRDHRSFVMADIPGIIEGAAEGKGLGTRFLRHIERNSILLFLIPSDARDIKSEFDILLNELQQFNPELLDKDRIIAISKSDLLDDELQTEMSVELGDIPHLFISSIAQTGLIELKDKIWSILNQ
jgi:GTP-binding protein